MTCRGLASFSLYYKQGARTKTKETTPKGATSLWSNIVRSQQSYLKNL